MGAEDAPRDLAIRAGHRRLRRVVARQRCDPFAASGPRPCPPERHETALAADMRDFAQDVADRLESHRLAGEFGRLAIFATPPMLALLREEMAPGLRALVVAETTSDLVQAPGPTLVAAALRAAGRRPPEGRP